VECKKTVRIKRSLRSRCLCRKGKVSARIAAALRRRKMVAGMEGNRCVLRHFAGMEICTFCTKRRRIGVEMKKMRRIHAVFRHAVKDFVAFRKLQE
jgi:hypothetical protein